MKKRLNWLLALLLSLVVSIANAMTLAEAIKKVQRDTGGQILSAQTVTERGRQVHVIRVLRPDGRVQEIRLPAG
ncbi:MAG: hypothetical protein AAGE01_21020 [Pseudomonadota bacterium]